MTAPNITLDAKFTPEKPGMFCMDHKSSYCPCAVEFIMERRDIIAVEALVREGEITTSPNWSATFAIPIAPKYCVWEKITYTAVGANNPRGAHLQHTLNAGERQVWPTRAPWMMTLQRVMPGDSIMDLTSTVTTTLTDYATEYLDGRAHRPNVVGTERCKSQTHSFKYQRIVDMLFDPSSLRGMLEKGEDVSAQVTCMYTFWTHNRCMFCYVNGNFRDALRVNPSMQSLLGEAEAAPEDFSDMVPDSSTGRRPSMWKPKPTTPDDEEMIPF